MDGLGWEKSITDSSEVYVKKKKNVGGKNTFEDERLL